MWHKGELGLDKHEKEEIVPFNWVNCNVGGAVEDGKSLYFKINFGGTSELSELSEVDIIESAGAGTAVH